MTHVKISKNADSEAISVIVDGVDLSNSTLRDGFKVTFPFDEPPRIHMVIPADVLDIDLPDAIVKALREEPAEEPVTSYAEARECPACKAQDSYAEKAGER